MGFTTEWRGERDTSRRLRVLVVLSLLLHVPLTPFAAIAAFLAFLAAHHADFGAASLPPVALNEIPIDLVSDEQAGKGPLPTPTAAPDPEPKAAEDDKDPLDEIDDDEPPPERTPKARHDAGAAQPDGAAARADGAADSVDGAAPKADAATATDAAPPIASAAPDAGPAVASSSSGGGGIGDPVALSGAAGRIADSNANVRLILYMDRMRGHKLADRVATMLTLAYQWRDFFGPSGMDPLHDIDRILLAGPQLRDSSQVVAVLRYNIGQARVRKAIDALVQRDPEHGAWLDGKMAARVRADRADRVIALPAPNLLVVAPPSLTDRVIKLGKDTRFPAAKSGEVLSTYVKDPWRAFIGVPFEIPHSILWVRMKVTLTPEGGAIATLEAEDADAETAKRDAQLLEERLTAVTQIKGALALLTGGRSKLIESVKFSADGKMIRGEVVATADQLSYLVGFIASYAAEVAEQNAKKARAAAAAASASAAAPHASAPPASSAAPKPSSSGAAARPGAPR